MTKRMILALNFQQVLTGECPKVLAILESKKVSKKWQFSNEFGRIFRVEKDPFPSTRLRSKFEFHVDCRMKRKFYI